MRPLFTIHAGEFLVGEYIENSYKSLNVWVPAKDTGVDLLITDKSAKKATSIQVKLSRDYSKPEAVDDFDRELIAGGWLLFDHEKIENSLADWWVIILVSHESRMKPQFIVIPPTELLSRLEKIHGKSKKYHFYPWVTKSGLCLDGRGIRKQDRISLSKREFDLGPRDLSNFLNNWSCLANLETEMCPKTHLSSGTR